ncbi:cytidine deaminase [Radiomyces spectabilis]|uniref:cytidine deaminase n=1 Tax=Radiomyces spectabilis TaxID=64574 RepID=UPI002220328B|nr:cytidine deaminase [Radiomyces spectabilis]KAI8384328.1 cytidine deaminase [Radiomyces spectabilis]
MTGQTLTEDRRKELFQLALDAKEKAYCPYSKFRVGAALLAEDGTMFQGCNVENASYGGAICAERTAYVKAVSEGHTRFVALAAATDEDAFCSPCGICRQFISEFGPANMPVYLLNTKGEFTQMTIEELLPYSFSLEKNKQ